jgi:hypothetical protein
MVGPHQACEIRSVKDSFFWACFINSPTTTREIVTTV